MISRKGKWQGLLATKGICIVKTGTKKVRQGTFFYIPHTLYSQESLKRFLYKIDRFYLINFFIVF